MHTEASKTITIFEKELNQKLLSSLRRQLIENSQGYPWLLKKLSIHIYEQIQTGASQAELMDKALDIGSLFEKDLQKLTQQERTCLKLIAESAPADWYKILEASDQNILQALLNKRLVVRSGDRLNLYWDIFREFVLTKHVPHIPVTYLPSHPSIESTLMVAQQLDSKDYCDYAELSKLVNMKDRTIDNIVRDLKMFGVTEGSHSRVKLDERMSSSKPETVLKRLRRELEHHALTIALYKYEGASVTEEDIIELLKEINPAAQHQERTWRGYAKRMIQWLLATGYIVPGEEGWQVEDQGDVNTKFTKVSVGYYKQDNIFFGDAPPARTVEALEWLMSSPPQSWAEITAAGYRNGAIVLRKFRIIFNVEGVYSINESIKSEGKSANEIVWNAALNDPIIQKSVEFLRKHQLATGYALADSINDEYQRNWSSASKKRIGNSLKQWAQWLITGVDSGTIPAAFGRRRATVSTAGDQLSLF